MTECVIWIGRLNSNGYGVTKVNGRQVYAHRLAWEVANGPIPVGMVVMHSCDNPPCVRVDHLRLGTRTENSADMMAKGRSAKGERHSQARLTEEQVRAIRALYAAGHSQRRIADSYGVSRSAVGFIVNRQRWAHVA